MDYVLGFIIFGETD